MLVVDASEHGTVVAEAYRQINPPISMDVSDVERSGGTSWAASPIYPDLMPGSPTGFSEFSDVCPSKELGLKEVADPQAITVNVHLQISNTMVLNIENEPPAWNLYINARGLLGAEDALSCDKLVLVTSMP